MARVLCWACLLLLGACAPAGPEEALQDYTERLANTLALEAPQPVFVAAPTPPRVATLQVELAGSKVDTLDFLALSGCAVQATIGKRNTSLGRFARPSQRLLLELEYLQRAPACVAHLREKGKNTLAEDLQQALVLKQSQLPARIFNATLGSEEYRQFWLNRQATEISSAPITALEAINTLSRQWLAGDYQADNQDFEILLSEVRAGDGGAVQGALLQQAAWLTVANQLLIMQRHSAPLCAQGLRPQKVEILENVMRKVFIGQVQPHAALLARRHIELLAPLHTLERELAAVLPPAYRLWAAARDSQMDVAMAAPKRHVQQLQQSLAPCKSTT